MATHKKFTGLERILLAGWKKQGLPNIECGKRTFFFDLNLASNNKNYLKITESRVPEAEGEKGKRTSFVLFPEDIKSFQTKIEEVVSFFLIWLFQGGLKSANISIYVHDISFLRYPQAKAILAVSRRKITKIALSASFLLV